MLKKRFILIALLISLSAGLATVYHTNKNDISIALNQSSKESTNTTFDLKKHPNGTITIKGTKIPPKNIKTTNLIYLNRMLKIACNCEIALDKIEADSIIVHSTCPVNLFCFTVRITNSEQKLILQDKSIITGDIVFEQPGGVVILKSGSKIEGQVIGGTIQKR
jgi:hypothetical protein